MISLAVQRFHGEINNESAKRVEVAVRTFSDAGSIPAASTIRRSLRELWMVPSVAREHSE